MRPNLLFFTLFSLFYTSVFAQNGCPGCVVALPALPADTIYLPALPDGQEGQAYDKDYSFRLPKTTTPFAAIDSTTPPGLTITKMDLISISGLPSGLDWTPNQWSFDPAIQTDGCMKICGTPEESDSFILMVKAKVTVFVITKEVEFPLHLYIAPKVSNTVGFSVTNFTGCGQTTASFTNNIPSNGHSGITYHWDFGDGSTSANENPADHPYTTPGTYIVHYKAVIDTVGYILKSATVLDVECVDELGVGDPDLYVLIKKPNGAQIYDSSPDINNAQLPYTFQLNIPLGSGNYNLAVWDEDSGLKGSDDPCGNVSFNILSNDTIVSGGFAVILNIVHPVDSVISTDTIRVFEQPAQPVLTAPFGLSKCSGSSTQIRLNSSAGTGNQWWRNGEEIAGATDSSIVATQSGFYQVQVITPEGCSAVSDSIQVQIFPQPASPVYMNHNNLLKMADTTNLPAQYSLQWFFSTTAIAGADGFKYCATADGIYGLEIKDLQNGCSSYYSATVDYNPNFDCTVGVDAPEYGVLELFPNPTAASVTIQLPQTISASADLQIWDMTGRNCREITLVNGISQIDVDCRNLPAGIYNVMLRESSGQRMFGKLIVMK